MFHGAVESMGDGRLVGFCLVCGGQGSGGGEGGTLATDEA